MNPGALEGLAIPAPLMEQNITVKKNKLNKLCQVLIINYSIVRNW